jgi:predicted nucleic-acid-binding protein
MIGIDTNIVPRYLLKDDPALSPRALEIIAANDCFVTQTALAEVVYTLESYYRSSRADIGRALDSLFFVQH